MKLAVSNIVWKEEPLQLLLHFLRELRCDGVELAPSSFWPEPVRANSWERQQLRRQMVDAQLELVGFHALLFTRPDLLLFGSPSVREATLQYLAETAGLCAELGGKVLVFGSPRNRCRGQLSPSEALARAADFFSQLAVRVEDLGVVFCIEPLGPDETDFITSTAEGLRLVHEVDHPSFQLHLDAKALIAANEDFDRAFLQAQPWLLHFHVGDPGLAPPGTLRDDHFAIGQALRTSGYDRYVSIEMRSGFGPAREVIQRSVEYVREAYFHVRQIVSA